jgi:glycosyltransferase 2 family protein
MNARVSAGKTLDRRRIFRWALLLIPLGILGNVAVSLWMTDRQLLHSLSQFPRYYLWVAAALAMVPWITNALRLLVWTRFLNHGVTARQSFQIAVAMDLGSAVSPTAVGGGLAKWGMLVHRGVSPGAAGSVTSIGILEDAVFFAAAVPLALYFSPLRGELGFNLDMLGALQLHAGPTLLLLAGGLVGVSAAARLGMAGGFGGAVRARSLRVAASWRMRLRRFGHDARDALRLIAAGGKKRFALTLSLTAVQWTCRYSVISALLMFLGAPVDPLLYFALQWVVFTMMTFFPTPGATGGAEAAFLVLYAPLLPQEILGLAMAGWRFLTFYMLIGLAAVVFAVLQVRRS